MLCSLSISEQMDSSSKCPSTAEMFLIITSSILMNNNSD